jgi:hypothetical protein
MSSRDLKLNSSEEETKTFFNGKQLQMNFLQVGHLSSSRQSQFWYVHELTLVLDCIQGIYSNHL